MPANFNTITSITSVFLLGVQSVYPTPVQLQEFGVDDAFTTDLVDTTETQIGVDGFGVSGYVPRSPEMTIRLLASSLSNTVFENWIAAQDQAQEVLYCNAIIRLSSIRRQYTCYKGSLMRVSSIADARRVLANREYHVKWLPAGPIPAITATPL